MKYIVDTEDGTFYGPFDTEDEAYGWAEEESLDNYRVRPLHDPDRW